MAIDNYTNLVAATADYLARSDLNTRIPDFVTLAEAHFNRELRTNEMIQGALIPILFNQTAIPDGYLEWISCEWHGARVVDLKYCEPDSEAWRFRYRPNGDPSMFTVAGNSIVIRPFADGSNLLRYYATLPPLRFLQTNWLLTKCPDLYLYRTLAEAYIYQKNDTKAAEFLALAGAETTKATEAADSNKLAKRPNSQPPGDDTGTA